MQPTDAERTVCVSFLCVYVFGAATLRAPTTPPPDQSVAPYNAQNQEKAHLEIFPRGETQNIAVGSSMRLTCKPRVADTKLISDIQWLDPLNRKIENFKLLVLPLDSSKSSSTKPSMYTEVHEDNSNWLFINNMKEDDAGKYICNARYAVTEMLSKEVIIEPIVAITWDDAPTNQYPILGEDFAIKCRVRARPSPTVDWFFNGNTIKTDERYVIETHALVIKNVRDSDEGIYTCRATIEETGELKERPIRVEVLIKPNIEELTAPVEVVEGETANIICKGTGKPLPKYSWIKSLTKEDLSQADRFVVNADTGVLTITNVRREDTGEYQCAASNQAGIATMNIQVNVIVKPKIMDFLNQTVVLDKKATMTCKAFGKPPPKISFRKHTSDRAYEKGTQPEDDRINTSNSVNEIAGETVGELTIDNTLRSNDGLYECIAENKGGKAFKNAHLIVEFPPSFASMSNRTIYSWDALPVNLTCIAESIPNATIRWTYYGERPVDDPNIRIIGTGPISTLLIRPIDRRYYMSYKCIATNKHGEVHRLIELREATRPAEIIQAKMTEVTATTVSFEIVPPDAQIDLPIRTISVQYKKQDTPWVTALNRTWSAGPITTKYVVENLEPQTFYDFRFAAANDAGRGNWGQNKQFSTTVKSVPGLVQYLSVPEDRDYVTSRFHDRYDLKWKAAADNGERIDYYEIKWCLTKKYSGDQWESQESSCSSKTENKQESLLINLNPDSYYKVQVRAHNFLGFGAPANLTIKTTRGNMSNASVLQHEGPIISSAAIIGIVIAVLLIIMLITDAILCCTNHSGIIYYMCERSRRKPVDEEDAKLGRDEKEPLKEEKKITPIIDTGMRRETSVTFDGKRSISKTGFVGKDSAV